MSRSFARSTLAVVLPTAVVAVVALGGCNDLEGRQGNRTGNRMFREMQFIEAAAEYESAIKKVDHAIIHYNLGLTYSKIAKGADKTVRLGVKGDFACRHIPGVQDLPARVCLKTGDRRYKDCDEENVCASSYKCEQTTLCALPAKTIAEMATKHFQTWLAANPKDTETEKLMTQVWLDSSQFDEALMYWEAKLAAKPAAKPDDTEIMGNLAGINLKADKWRESIDWYTKVADASTDTSNKVAAFQFIGNVAWSKLNSKVLGPVESVELADRGIDALQKAGELAPKNQKLFGLMASLYNFRGLAHGVSWAAAIDRASAQDLQKHSRVLAEEAKRAAEGQATPTPTPASPTKSSGAPAEKPAGG